MTTVDDSGVAAVSSVTSLVADTVDPMLFKDSKPGERFAVISEDTVVMCGGIRDLA